MKNVYSLAFFRHRASAYESERCGEARGRFFVNFLPSVIRAFRHVWLPGWELVIHHDEDVRDFPYFSTLERMGAKGVLQLVALGNAPSLCGAMLWRLRPVFDPDVKYVVCRDVDSLPMPRDKKMVDEFIRLGGGLHAIHDSISHSGPLMGGTVSFNAEWFRKRTGHRCLDSLLAAGAGLGIEWNEHGADQRFLNGVIEPYLGPHMVLHTKRDDVRYLAQATLRVAAQEAPEDFLANHVGGAYAAEEAKVWYDAHHPDPEVLECEKC